MFVFEQCYDKNQQHIEQQLNQKYNNQLIIKKVITEGKRGFFGFGSQLACTEFLTGEMISRQLGEYVRLIVTQMGISIETLTIENQRRKFIIKIETDKNGLLIGRDGETLEALQLILQQALKNHLGEFMRLYVELNIANYREQEIAKLQRQARILARKVHKEQQAAQFEPMSSSARKIIHNELAHDQFVQTRSVGKEPNRYVQIILRPDVEQRPQREK